MSENGKTEWEKGMNEIREQIAEMNRMYIKNNTEWERRYAQNSADWEKRHAHTQRHLDHISKLVGLVFENLDDFGEQVEGAGKSLRYKRK